MRTSLKSSNPPKVHVDLGSLQKALRAIGALDAILDSPELSTILTDETGVIQLFNLGARRLLGYSSEEVIGTLTLSQITNSKVVRERALSLSLGTTMASFEELALKAARGIQDRSELTFTRKDGCQVVGVVSVMALLDDRGQLLGHSLIGSREKLRLFGPQFRARASLEEKLGALMTIDSNGIITDINKQMEALTGCTREEVIGGPFKRWFTEPHRAQANLELVLREKAVTECELTARGRNGREAAVSLRASPFHNRRKQAQGMCAVARLR